MAKGPQRPTRVETHPVPPFEGLTVSGLLPDEVAHHLTLVYGLCDEVLTLAAGGGAKLSEHDAHEEVRALPYDIEGTLEGSASLESEFHRSRPSNLSSERMGRAGNLSIQARSERESRP